MSPVFENQERFNALRSLFDMAETKLKETEQLCGDLAIPSVNELRYAGYHITKAMCESDDTKHDEELRRAERHCKRAIYDANEVGIEYLLRKIADFKDTYSGSSKVTEVIQNYSSCLADAQEAADLISKARKNNGESRESYYEQCEPHYEKLNKINGILEQSAPQINQLEEQQQMADKKASRRFWVQISIMLLGITISLAIFIK